MDMLTLKIGWPGCVNVYVTLLPKAVVVSVKKGAGSLAVDNFVRVRICPLVLILVLRNGALGTTAVCVAEGWLTLDAGVEIARAVDELKAPRSEDEDAPLTGMLVVTIEKSVVAKLVTVVKRVSVLVPWDDSETAVVRGLRSIR